MQKSQIVFFIYDILKKHSDENHPLKLVEIKQILESQNIFCNRKTIASNLNLLNDVGVEIEKTNNGVYLAQRPFEKSELIFLVDSIFSNPVIPYNYAKDLINKLLENTSEYERKKFDYIYKTNEVIRTNNKEIFYVIEIINKAINENKKICFNYNFYNINSKLVPRKTTKYVVNPYFTINNKSKYFLVANTDKYDNISNYRIDYITDIEILNQPIKPMSKILSHEQIYDPVQYANKNAYMMQGKCVEVEVVLDNEKTLGDLIDWFGEKIEIFQLNGKIHAKLKVNENTIVFWALQYGEHVEIVKPDYVRNKVVSIVNILKEKYNCK